MLGPLRRSLPCASYKIGGSTKRLEEFLRPVREFATNGIKRPDIQLRDVSLRGGRKVVKHRIGTTSLSRNFTKFVEEFTAMCLHYYLHAGSCRVCEKATELSLTNCMEMCLGILDDEDGPRSRRKATYDYGKAIA
jgi:hypothetical protein